MNAGGLTRRVGIVACGRAATTLSIFGVNAILTRAWDGAGFGTFTVVWVLGNTLVPVFLLGMPTALLYFFPRRRPNERTTLVLQVAGCLLLSAGVLALLLVVAGPTIAHLLNIEAQSASLDLSSYLWPFLPYVVSLVAGGYVESVLIAAGRPLRQATLSIIWAAALIAVSLVVAAFGLEVREALLALSAVGICRFVVGSAMAIQAVASHSKTDWTIAAFAEVISYSLPIALNDTVGSLSRSVDRLVVLYFFSAETLGMYHVGAIEVPISLLLTAVVTVLIPEVSRLHGEGDTVEICRLWKRSVSRLSMVITPLFFFLFAFAGPIIAIYLPQEYGSSEQVFRIFLLPLPLRCAIYNPLLVGMGRARWALWASVGDLCVNLLLSVALVMVMMEVMPESAFLGPALATVAATYAQVAVLLVVISRLLRSSLLQLLPWGRIARITAFSGVAAGVAFYVSRLTSPQPLVQLVVGAALFAVVLAAAVQLVAADRQELHETIRSLMSSEGAR